MPSLTASTRITARYGCAKPVVPKVESVWDENYVGVWHMGEQKLPLADSSNVSRDVTSADGTGIGYGFAGLAGGAVDFGAANSSRSVNMDDHSELDGFKKLTVEAWTKQDSHSVAVSFTGYAGGETLADFPVLVRLSESIDGFSYADFSLPNAADLYSNKYTFPGAVDELRISNVARSGAWIKATYDTVANPAFATYSTSAGTLSGYGAWMNAKELVGKPEAKSAKGIENAIRYAFDIAQ